MNRFMLANLVEVVDLLVKNGSRKATMFVDGKTAITAARRFRPHKRERITEIVLKVGALNFKERDFIKRKHAKNEPVPFNRVLLKDWPKR